MADSQPDWNSPPPPDSGTAWSTHAGPPPDRLTEPAVTADPNRPPSPDRRHRGRRILGRIFTLLPILGFGGLALVGIGHEVFFRSRDHYELFPIVLPLMLVLPFLMYSLFSRFPVLRLTAVTASLLTSLVFGSMQLLFTATFLVFSYGYRDWIGFLLLAGLGLLSLLCAAFSAWLVRLELDLLRPRAAAGETGGWQTDSTVATAPDTPEPEAPVRGLLTPGRCRVYRLMTLLPVTAYSLLGVYLLTLALAYAGRDSGMIIVGLVLLFAFALAVDILLWLRFPWLRVIAVGINILIAFAGACGLAAFTIDELRRWSYRTYSGTPLTLGLADPDGIIYLIGMSLLGGLSILCCIASFRLLRHEVAEFQRTAAPLPAAAPAVSKAEDDITPAGDWDQGRKG